MTHRMGAKAGTRKSSSKKAAPRGEAKAKAPGRRTPKAGGRVTPTALLERRVEKLTSLLDVAKALTAERDLDTLLKMILGEAVRVVNADRCTLWIVDQDRNELWTKVAHGMGADRIRIPLGVGIAGQVASTGKVINIPDAYADARFNRQVDKDTGYRTRNMLGIPMRSHNGDVTGVLQALNKLDGSAFNNEDEELMLALGSNAAAAIENAILYEEIDRLFEGFVKASVVAIEARDPTTSGHSERVALLTIGIAEKTDRTDSGPFKDVTFTREDMREIRYAALLHDFGKVGVREHVLTKAKKLYPGELEVVETRFIALRAQREAASLRQLLAAVKTGAPLPDG
jgi:putative methionine-R-sulfoxide reductase with GAF domain